MAGLARHPDLRYLADREESSTTGKESAPVIETAGNPLGIIWVGAGLIAFYIALTWLNLLLGVFLTPLFLIPQTWLLERLRARKAARRTE